MRIISIDLGFKTMGICISDKLNLIPIPLNNFFYSGDRNITKLIIDVHKIISEYKDVTNIILGYPGSDFNNDNSDIKKYIKEFYNSLVRDFPKLNIKFVDEENTTKLGHDLVKKMRIKEYKKIKDVLSAYIMLRDYLNVLNIDKI